MQVDGLRTGELARLLHMTPNTLRAWERRYGVLSIRTTGGHRRYPRDICLGLREAVLDEDLTSLSAVQRARELVRSGALDDPLPLVQRMDKMETALMRLTQAVEVMNETRGQA